MYEGAGTYQQDAMRSKSEMFCPGLLSLGRMLEMCYRASTAGEAAKLLKKAAFAGKVSDETTGFTMATNEVSVFGADMLHGILGVINESGEVAQALEKVLRDRDSYDPIDFDEEFGDLLWFIAVYCEGRGIRMQTLMERNIAKLKARYPDKFDAAKMDDENRDLNAERAALEGKNTEDMSEL